MDSSSSKPVIPDLPGLVAATVQERKRLLARRETIRETENRIRAALDAFSDTTAGPISAAHPLPEIKTGGAAAEAPITAACAEMVQARDEAAAARAHQEAVRARLPDAKSRLSLHQTLGWIATLIAAIALGAAIAAGAALVALLPAIGTIMLRARDARAVTAIEAELASAARAEADARSRLGDAKARAFSAWDTLPTLSAAYFARELERDARAWRAVWDALPPFLRGVWDESSWKQADLSVAHRLPVLVAGFVREEPAESETAFVIPYFAPFLSAPGTTIVTGDPAVSLPWLHGMILQLATALPYQATFMLMDPSGSGRAFPMQRGLPFVRRVGADLFRDLEPVLEDITRIIQTYIDAETKSFEQLPVEIQANERFEFLIAANFPHGYDRRAIETLQKIAKNGPTAGKYLFLQLSPDKDLPRDLSWDDFGRAWKLDPRGPLRIDFTGTCLFEPLACPEGKAQAHVLDRLAAARPPETRIAWRDLGEPSPAKWWHEDSSRMVSAPIGASGRERRLAIWFGANRDGRPCAHGILGAMTGSGKSNLYHVLICSLATRYGPDELSFFLIDGKYGVEFEPYRRLPHARVVALNSSAELSRSVLEELLAEMKRRNELFKSLGVSDLAGFRASGRNGTMLPRIVLLVDEYQELFEGDTRGRASAALLQLAQQGRSAGIHMLLASQRFGAAGMTGQAAIFGNIHLRMAMKMSSSDVQALTEFGRNGKRLVEQCDLPGKIVLNDQSGEDKANEFGKVALLDDAERKSILQQLVDKADREWPAERRRATIIFDGRQQPNFAENPQALQLLRLPRRPETEAWRRIATAPAHENGLGVTDWFGGERPLTVWTGQQLNVHGQAQVILRRRAMENLLVVGENQPAAYGLLLAALCSVPINEPPGGVRLLLVDRAVPGTPWENALETAAVTVLRPYGYTAELTRESRQAVAWFEVCTAELTRRAALDEATVAREPTWLLVLAAADRLPPLLRTPGKFGTPVDSPDGEKLKRICREGPALGVHVIATFPAASPLLQVFERAQIEQFKHRVVTQLSENDSFLLIGRDHASRLQEQPDARPVFAIYKNLIGGAEMKFKPYTSDPQMPWVEQCGLVASHLARWKEAAHVDG